MNKLKLSLVALLAISGVRVNAQNPFNVAETIDVNNISATMLVHGDLWRSTDTSATAIPAIGPKTFFPKGTAQTINFAGGLWMSAYDQLGNLHVAAQTYRTNHDVEYWPGPLDATDTATYAESQKWAKVWKVSRWDIQYHRSTVGYRDSSNVPSGILTWPAKGNIYARGYNNAPLNISSDIAPFVDLNHNGTYEPLLGEYPDVPGDEALFTVFNDNGATHALTHGKPLGIEVHAMAYAYSRGSLIDNVIYYDYNIVNKSNYDYKYFRLGIWDDVNIGYGGNDFIGYNATLRMGIGYNGTNDDTTATGAQPAYSYGKYMPKMGITLISSPNDTTSVIQAAGSFMTYNPSSPTDQPTSDVIVNNYLNARLSNGQHLTHDSDGCTSSPFGAYADYIYDGSPSTGGWSECACNNTPGDRRFILSTNDFKMPPGFTQHMTMAMVVSPLDSNNNGCPTNNFSDLNQVADTAWSVYRNPLVPAFAAGVTNAAVQQTEIHIYPNPAHDRIYITHSTITTGETVIVYNTLGQVMNVQVSTGAQKTELNISSLPSGVYSILYRAGDAQSRVKFIKE